MTQIHPTAIVDKGAEIGNEVTIGPHCVIAAGVVLEDRVTLKGNVWVEGNVHIGEGSTVWPGAVLGAKTQDLKYRGEKTFVSIGKNTDIREYVTINSSCGEGTHVKVGDGCLIMAYCHVAHNCEVGNRVIMSNNTMLAGHVIVEDFAIIGGLTGVHQHCRIGSYAMVGGMSGISNDVLPYTIGAGNPFRYGGLNLIGLKRHNMPLKTRSILAQAFRLLVRSKLPLEVALRSIEQDLERIPEIEYLLNFCKNSKRGISALGGTCERPSPAKEEPQTVDATA
jgi:UDP-N-acetylglucosamine acyltransferase